MKIEATMWFDIFNVRRLVQALNIIVTQKRETVISLSRQSDSNWTQRTFNKARGLKFMSDIQ